MVVAAGTGMLTLICSTIFMKIEEGVVFDDRIASARDRVRTANQSNFLVVVVTVRSALISSSYFTFIISKMAGTALADIRFNMMYNWNLMQMPNFMPDRAK